MSVVATIRAQAWKSAAGGLAALGLAAGAWYIHAIASVGAGYKAKILCSAVFVSKRPPEAVLAEDLKVDGLEMLTLFSHDIGRRQPSVTASLFGLVARRAVYRETLGCTLAIGRTEDALRTGTPAVPEKSGPAEAPWPAGRRAESESLSPGIDSEALSHALAAAFAEPDAQALQRTRALVVVHKGRIVAERYARGFGAQMPLPGWSMSKTALNALIGIRVRQGKLKLNDRKLLPAWRDPEDPRSRITLDDLLRMSSGLEFSEDYDSRLSDVVTMLFAQGDKAGFAAARPLARAPGSRWAYSSGTSNIVSLILRRTFRDQSRYLAFPRRELFSRLGMESAVLEPDPSGTFTASSFMYASARDWARLGLLYLNDGVWQGERILPEGWVAASLRPTSGSQGQFGAHLWLELPMAENGGEPPLPEDAYYMLGHEGQIVAVIPSLELVIVRMGLARKPGAWKPAAILAPIAAAFK